MAWQTPKTNWVSTDYFNIEDYNRIIGNIQAIHELSLEVNPEFNLELMDEKNSYEDYIYADEFNAIESNLELISAAVYPYISESQKMYYPNQPTPDYAEFNRIENFLLERYEFLRGQVNGRKMLSFVLGGSEF